MNYTRDSISCCTCVKKSIIDIAPRFSSEWRRTETVPFSTSRSHITSIYGIFLIPIITDLCIYSFAAVINVYSEPCCIQFLGHSLRIRQMSVSLRDQDKLYRCEPNGEAPPKCSINTPMKHSIDPNNAL